MDHLQNWETINSGNYEHTQRMPVPGGWIYRTYMFGSSEDSDTSVALTFVPDNRVFNID